MRARIVTYCTPPPRTLLNICCTGTESSSKRVVLGHGCHSSISRKYLRQRVRGWGAKSYFIYFMSGTSKQLCCFHSCEFWFQMSPPNICSCSLTNTDLSFQSVVINPISGLATSPFPDDYFRFVIYADMTTAATCHNKTYLPASLE